MAPDLEAVYAKYKEYVSDLHADLDVKYGREFGEEFRAPLLPLPAFMQVWKRWGKVSGLQKQWKDQLEGGYHRFVAGMRDRLQSPSGSVNEMRTMSAA